MTKFLPFVVAVFFAAFQINAQVIFYNDFTEGLGDMTAVDNDKRVVHPNVAGIGPSFSVGSVGGERGNVANATSWFNPAGKSDNWLITPKLKIEGENVVLQWKALAQDGNFRDGYRVKVSTTDNKLSSFTEELLVVRMENATWTDRALDLSAYNGQEIYVAFQHDSDDMFILRMDDILVYNRFQKDAEVKTFAFDNKTCLVNQNIKEVSFNLTNQGVDTITSFTAELTYKEETTIHQFSDLAIATGATRSFSIDRNFRFNEDIHSVILEIVDINDASDDNSENNVVNRIFESNPFVLDFNGTDTKDIEHSIAEDLKAGKVVILDFYASWCGPCEVSTPALNKLYVENIDIMNVYGITVEPTDDAAVVDALPWGATYPKFPYTLENRRAYVHYGGCLELNNSGSIPFFVMLCPADLDESNITDSHIGSDVNAKFTSWSANAKVCQMTSSIDDIIQTLESMGVRPNPASQFVELELNTENMIDITIIDNLGRVVKQISQNSKTVEVSELPSGTYHIKAQTGDKSYQTRFIKQ